MLTYRLIYGEKEVITMSKKFYAIYDELDFITEVFVFDTEADRDSWVNFQDNFSQEMHTTADSCIFRRTAVTVERLKDMLDSDDDRERFDALENGDDSNVVTSEYDSNIKLMPVWCCR